MTREEAIKLLKVHRNGSIKPTEKVKEAIDVILSEKAEVVTIVDSRVKPLQNRCYALSQGELCMFCPMECEHRSNLFRGTENSKEQK